MQNLNITCRIHYDGIKGGQFDVNNEFTLLIDAFKVQTLRFEENKTHLIVIQIFRMIAVKEAKLASKMAE